MALAKDPYAGSAPSENAMGFHTLHVHGWRVLYSVDEDSLSVTVYRIAR